MTQYWRIMIDNSVIDKDLRKFIDVMTYVDGLHVPRIRRSTEGYRELWFETSEPVDMRVITNHMQSIFEATTPESLCLIDQGYVAPERDNDAPEWWLVIRVCEDDLLSLLPSC